MEFEGQYLTYDEYEELGGTLDLMSFNLLEFEARKQIDLRTQNRLKGVDKVPFEVILCELRLIDRINSYINTTNSADKNIASESIDGYSVSYVTNSQINDIVKSKNNELQDIMLSYLYGIVINGEHIIYNGVN